MPLSSLFNVTLHETDEQWRMRAVELAVRRGLMGQAALTKVRFDPRSTLDVDKIRSYACASASEPLDYTVMVDDALGCGCNCVAGKLQNPCAHAGAALLLDRGLVPSRTRPTDPATSLAS